VAFDGGTSRADRPAVGLGDGDKRAGLVGDAAQALHAVYYHYQEGGKGTQHHADLNFQTKNSHAIESLLRGHIRHTAESPSLIANEQFRDLFSLSSC
jgi:hypothetical protein